MYDDSCAKKSAMRLGERQGGVNPLRLGDNRGVAHPVRQLNRRTRNVEAETAPRHRFLVDAGMEIGEAFGGRDHGTVLHAYRLVRERMGDDDKVRQVVKFLSDQLHR